MESQVSQVYGYLSLVTENPYQVTRTHPISGPQLAQISIIVGL